MSGDAPKPVLPASFTFATFVPDVAARTAVLAGVAGLLGGVLVMYFVQLKD